MRQMTHQSNYNSFSLVIVYFVRYGNNEDSLDTFVKCLNRPNGRFDCIVEYKFTDKCHCLCNSFMIIIELVGCLGKHLAAGIFRYANFEYDGGDNFLRRNFMIYNGKHETNVIASTFQMNSYDHMKSQSDKRKKWKDLDEISFFEGKKKKIGIFSRCSPK